MILTLTVGNEICYADILICLLSISTCLVTYAMRKKLMRKYIVNIPNRQ